MLQSGSPVPPGGPALGGQAQSPSVPGGPPGAASETRVRVRKLRRDGSVRIAYEALRQVEQDGGLLVAARWAGGTWQGRWARMEPGDPCREFYRPGACLAVLQLMSPNGTSRGFYVDLCEPVQVRAAADTPAEPVQVSYRDLELDLFVTPDGAWHLLDETEFLEWVLDGACPQEVAWVVQGLAECLDRWQRGAVPFDGQPGS